MTEADLIREFAAALTKGTGCLFVGSGVSAGSGLPDWKGALADLVKARLSIDLDQADNYPLIGQFLVNESYGNRGPLIKSLKDTFHRLLRQNSNHAAIALMNVKAIWTTNYDTLLEGAFAGSHITIRHTDDNITWPVPAADIEIIKMHGCIDRSNHDDIIITLEDYEDYHINRPATVQHFQHELMNKSFLFVGYSFRDPDITSIMTIARRLKGAATQTHYMIMKRDNPTQQRTSLWYKDLLRIGIHVVEVDGYDKLPQILTNIAKKSVGDTVYFTGSHEEQADGERAFCEAVGKGVAEIYKDARGQVLAAPIVMDGQSTGRSRSIISAFTNTIIHHRLDIRRHIDFYTNPYALNPHLSDDPSLLPQLELLRAQLMKRTQVIVAFDGKIGTAAEVRLARKYRCHILPVPRVKGGSASELLRDTAILGRLNASSPKYLAKARRRKLTAIDVAEAVRALLESHVEDL
ncbi:SIR2 family protein [Frigoriglobus tundricola]|uniref:Deacetylase sirtuin-type domain-containing protein n=1 Tax=Frigoriglobus tundricola TaxID=2774151 RepID=A0A6M5YNR4_9BACT|nr:SIR2 family protein [Frigoriglobus tundricola]QJW95625.1 hypothetical protein FTUN_3176 [Frigoriglobus tundricola]